MSNRFKIANWALHANVYEVNVRQYTKTGSFTAFAKSLPRLAEMGVKILWFMPIHPISFKKRLGTLGSYYANSDYKAVNPEFGSLEDFKNIVEQAHQLGMKVIIDWVANHTGCDHVWVNEHNDFYKKNQQGQLFDEHGWEDVYDLDYTNHKLWEEMIDTMKYWISECDIDGYRCDMAHLVPLEFWNEARRKLDKEKKLFWLAECEVPAYHEVFDATYTWEFMHTIQNLYNKKADRTNLEAVLIKYETTFPADALRLYFTSNHDENSHSGSEQERLGNSALVFAVFSALWKNSLPLVYSGQELPNTKRLKFFDKDEIEWTGECHLEDFYKTLFALRTTKEESETVWKCDRLETTNDDKIFAFIRVHNKQQQLVLLNLSPADKVKFLIKSNITAGKYESAFSGIVIELDQETSFELQQWEYVIYILVN